MSDPSFPSRGLSDDDVAEAAALWATRIDRGLTRVELENLRAWQAADERHGHALTLAQADWRLMDGLPAAPGLDSLAEGVFERAQRRQRARRLIRWGGWTVGAAAALMFGLVAWFTAEVPYGEARVRLPNENYRVIASTLRTEMLPDGTLAELNGASRIEVDFTAQDRRVRLVVGEAHFVVARNPDRPFYVTAGPVTVRAVGTAFNVRLASEQIEVLVTEGKVKLQASDTAPLAVTPSPDHEAGSALVEGERAVIARNAEPSTPLMPAIGRIDKAEIQATLGWQSTRLVFNNTPLDEVVEGFNRYNQHRLSLGDPRLRERALTGIFRADNLEGFVRLLKASVDVKAEQRTPTETVLLPIR